MCCSVSLLCNNLSPVRGVMIDHLISELKYIRTELTYVYCPKNDWKPRLFGRKDSLQKPRCHFPTLKTKYHDLLTEVLACWTCNNIKNWNHPPWRSGIRPWPKSQGEEAQWYWDRLAEKINLCIEGCNWPASFSKWIQACLTQGGGLQNCQNVTEQLIFKKKNISKTIWVKVFLTRNAPIPLRCMPSRQGYIPLHYALSSCGDEKDLTKRTTNQGIECLHSIHNLDIF